MLNRYYYDNLSIQEQRIYSLVETALRSRRSSVAFGVMSHDRIEAVWKAVALDHPEIVSFAGLFLSYNTTDSQCELFLEYCNIDEELYNTKISEIEEDISKEITRNDSDWTVCKKIYDYLAKSITYEYDLLDQYIRLQAQRSQSNNFGIFKDSEFERFYRENAIAFTAYGVAVNKRGVCMGIAKLYKILCDYFEVECACLYAKAKQFNEHGGEDEIEHMLNVVELDRTHRGYVDVTYGLIDKNIPIVKYNCFVESNRVAENLYNLETNFKCDEDENSYLHKHALVFFTAFDLRAYLEGYSYESSNGEIRFRYEGKQLKDAEIREIFQNSIKKHCIRNMRMPYTFVDHGYGCGLISENLED